jgi:uncharacterized membrane protein YfcA
MSPWLQLSILVMSAFAAGAVNAIAGGGTLLTYPALLAVGISPVHANATSTLALLQGQLAAAWGFRRRIDRRLALVLALPSLVGAVAGALLLVRISEHDFKLVVPWLILGATVLFLISDRMRPNLHARRLPLLVAAQLAVAVYGGFFGAGQSILMLAVLGFSGESDIDRMNALKNLTAALINGVAAALFVAGGLIEWRPVLILSVAAVAGGYTGAHFGQRIGQKNSRRAVVAVGLCTAAASFYKAFT